LHGFFGKGIELLALYEVGYPKISRWNCLEMTRRQTSIGSRDGYTNSEQGLELREDARRQRRPKLS
jgi:hypothetical protein